MGRKRQERDSNRYTAKEYWQKEIFHIPKTGKRELDSLLTELGAMVTETIMDIGGSAPDRSMYHPCRSV
jgi:hypothetical protein